MITVKPALSDRNDRADAAAAKAAREHAAIVSAAHMLEKALASPAVGREAAWKRNASPALGEVIESLKAHRESAENQGGVIAEAEAVLGRPRALAVARNQHTRLTREANELLVALNAEDPKFSFREIRRRGWRLTTLLHEHRALEADLIMQAFEHDIGGQG